MPDHPPHGIPGGDEREAFERWARSHGLDSIRHVASPPPYVNGNYVSIKTHHAWAAWQAASLAPAATLTSEERETVIDAMKLIEDVLVGENYGREPPSKYVADKARDIARGVRRKLSLTGMKP